MYAGNTSVEITLERYALYPTNESITLTESMDLFVYMYKGSAISDIYAIPIVDKFTYTS